MRARPFDIALATVRIGSTAALLFFSAQVGAIRVQVAAGTRLEGRADRDASSPNGVVIRGTLRDDVGHGVPLSHVSITFYEDPRASPLMLPAPRRCSDAGPGSHDPHVAPDEYVVDTDAEGSFCLRSVLPIEHGVMKLRFPGGNTFDATQAEIPFDLGRPSVVLSFEPEPTIVSLDRPILSVGIRVTAPGLAKDGFHVVLRDEKQTVLGSAPVDPDGLVRIEVPTDHLGAPGPGELSASLTGTALLARPMVHGVERHARVDLVLAEPNLQGTPEDGIAIAVRVQSARGPVTGGSVEAIVGNRSVGAAPVRNGAANVVATFAATREGAIEAALRYLPEAPWYEPGPNVETRLTVAPPSPWRRTPLIALALAVVLWMLRGAWVPRLRRGTPRRARATGTVAPQRPIVVAPRATSDGWIGFVTDAHDARPIAGAHVSIVRPSFPGADERLALLAEAVTAPDGHFALSYAQDPTKLVLRVRERWHAPFEQALPGPSELSITLVSRRRRLLDRMVDWATREWGAWEGAREPTPGQVAVRARRSAREPDRGELAGAERWARAVEQTAYGPEPVDEGAERAVTDLEPGPARGRNH